MAQGWYELKLAKNGQFVFNLKAKNHQENGRSQYYSSQAVAKKGIASVKRNAATTVVKDKTQEQKAQKAKKA